MQQKSRILLLDENQNNLSELERLLACLDADFTRACSGEQAARLTQENNFCVAIAAAGSPVTDVESLLAHLRQRSLAARVPVILVYPGYPTEAEARGAYASGVFDILFRPLIPTVLVEKVKTALAFHEQSRPAAAGAVRKRQSKTAEALFCWLSQSMEQIARAMASSPDMVEVPTLVLEQLPAVVPYERGSILMRDGDSLRIVAQRGFPPGWPITDARIPIRQGDVFQQIAETRQALLIDDVTTTPAWSQFDGLPLHRSWLGVPLLSRDHIIGMVSLTRKEAAAFRPEEVSFISASASQAAVALVNAGLLNELKHFNEQLEQVVRDRTEELNRAYARLEKIDKAKSSFISIAEHELRTPLTLIQGYASLLGSMVKDNAYASELAQGILTGERRLLDVVNNMVVVSKIDNQVLDVRRSQIDIWLIIKLVRSEFKTALLERRLELVIDDSENLSELHADTDLMGKLFRQLLSNAIKYTPDGGSITITGRNIPTRPESNGRGPCIEIQVADTGIGIDPAFHDLIFEKFYQMGVVELHSSGKTKFKGGGPGLGLAIARGIVQAHNGQIWVESPGHDESTCPGSCFHVVLPIA